MVDHEVPRAEFVLRPARSVFESHGVHQVTRRIREQGLYKFDFLQRGAIKMFDTSIAECLDDEPVIVGFDGVEDAARKIGEEVFGSVPVDVRVDAIHGLARLPGPQQ